MSMKALDITIDCQHVKSIEHRLAITQRGVSLLEVLVTLIILSIGFLAAANMQVQSMRTNQDAHLRAQALIVLGNMMDRMSSNPTAVAAGLYDNKSTTTLSEPTCLAAGCTDAELAAVDLFEFSASFESLRGEAHYEPVLPPDSNNNPALGTISAPVDGVYTLSVVWEQLSGNNLVSETVSVNFIP